MERLLTVLLAMGLLFVLVYFVTEKPEEPIETPAIMDVAPVVEEEEEIPTVEEEPEEPTTLKSFFKEEESEAILEKMDKEVTKLSADLSASVVSVLTQRDEENEDEKVEIDELHELLMKDLPLQSMNSGTVVDAAGYILTTYQAVFGAKDIQVSFSTGTSRSAKVVGVDPYTNLAVIQVDVNGLTPVVWADASDLRMGQFALNISVLKNKRSSLRTGYVSSLKRTGLLNNGMTYENFMELDMPDYEACSGSPVVNMKGQVMGIKMQVNKEEKENTSSYAVASRLASYVANSIINNGYVKRSRIGIRVQQLNGELAKSFKVERTTGTVITNVFENSPAEIAGLKAGDIVVNMGETKIDTSMDLRLTVARLPLDAETQFDIIRAGEIVTLGVTAQPQVVPDWRQHYENVYEEILDTNSPAASKEPSSTSFKWLSGITLSALTSSLATRYGIAVPETPTTGVIITNVTKKSVEEEAGLISGMLLLEINQQPVSSLQEYQSILESLPESESILLLVEQQGLRKFMVVSHSP
ncbi:MAG: trypsin-like peptidase domain-containing protein [Verrucomicrobiota bacterium]